MPAKGTLFLNRNSGVKADTEALIEAARAAELEIVDILNQRSTANRRSARAPRGASSVHRRGGDYHPPRHPGAGAHRCHAGRNPLGTYNHFARDLDIPLDWKEALEVALDGEAPRPSTPAAINERFFVNNVSLGLFRSGGPP